MISSDKHSFCVSEKMNATDAAPEYLRGADKDYFNKLFLQSNIKTVSIVTFFFVSTMTLILMFGIIWYEKNGRFRYRTVINRLGSSICWLTVWFTLLIYVPEGIRLMIGPLRLRFYFVVVTFVIAAVVAYLFPFSFIEVIKRAIEMDDGTTI